MNRDEILTAEERAALDRLREAHHWAACARNYLKAARGATLEVAAKKLPIAVALGVELDPSALTQALTLLDAADEDVIRLYGGMTLTRDLLAGGGRRP